MSIYSIFSPGNNSAAICQWLKVQPGDTSAQMQWKAQCSFDHLQFAWRPKQGLLLSVSIRAKSTVATIYREPTVYSIF